MATASTRWTAERVRELPDDGNRSEVIDGQLVVTPAPSWAHQDAAMQLVMRLHPYVHARGIGHAVMAPADVEFADDRLVEPTSSSCRSSTDGSLARGRRPAGCSSWSRFCRRPRLAPIER